ncbi:MAG: sigma-70 family RNA polymerase sigma factor [Planctomycetota bacterium]
MRNADEIFDEWLVLRCQGGDSKALTMLVERWQPRLLAFAIRVLGERDAAEDAVQTSWVDIVKRIRSVKDPKAIRPWLFRVVANKCTDIVRRRSKRRKSESAERADEVPDPGVEKRRREADRTERIARLRGVMKTLDEGHREVLRMHYQDGLTVDVIAKQLSIPAGTVKSRLYHARQKLKQSLTGENDE